MSNDVWFQPYKQQVGDTVKIGFDLTKCYSIKSDDMKNFKTDSQLAFLAATFAHKLLGYALTLETERPPIIERKPIAGVINDTETTIN